MHLLLMRHGVAVDLAALRLLPGRRNAKDEDRPLSPDGIRKTKRVAQGLRALGIKPDLIVHSGLVRTRETAEIVARELKPRLKDLVVSELLLSDADPKKLFEFAVKKKARRLLVVGHSPHVDRVVGLACGAANRLITSMGRAGVTCLDIPETGRPTGRLVWMLPPKLIRRAARGSAS